MATTKININGIHELDFVDGPVATITSPGVVAISGLSPKTHDEPLTDGNANIIFAATLTLGGDVIVVLGVPN